MTFTTQSLQAILPILKKRLHRNHQVTFQALNPDYMRGNYAGTNVEIEGRQYLYRSLKAWMELAELLGCRMLVPKEKNPYLIQLTFEKIKEHSFHQTKQKCKEEKYGIDSLFAEIHKMEEPAFFYYYLQALENVKVSQRKHILDLGINRGDEFEVIRKMVPPEIYRKMKLVGIDHSKSAIAAARTSFPETNVSLYAHDINDLAALTFDKFDLLISIGTLQSPGINYKPFLMELVQQYLHNDAALILGFPNSRWRGGEILYGAKAPNYAMSEMSLLFNDVIFAKKYLQQKKYRVTITGKSYLFLTATKITSKINQNSL
jgi:hypothetical protein